MSFRRKKSEYDVYENHMGKILTIYPTEDQISYIENTFNLYRFVYNWTIEQYESYYKYALENNLEYKCIDEKELQVRLSKLRNENEWLQKVPLGTLRNAMFDAVGAYEKFFDKRFETRHPRFKSKKRSKKQFAPRLEGKFYFEDNLVRIEGLPIGDKIETKYHTGYHKSDNIKFTNVRIWKDTNNKYKMSFCIPKRLPCYENKSNEELENYSYQPEYDRAIGIDLNKKKMIVGSDGTVIYTPNTKNIDKSIKRLSRKCSKDQKRIQRTNVYNDNNLPIKSNNSIKRQLKLSKKKRRKANIIEDAMRKGIKEIVSKKPVAIVMEDLNVKEMYSRSYIAKNIVHVPFRKIRDYTEWECKKQGTPFLLAPKDYPSSQLCSKCGSIRKIGSRKTYICHNCGLVIDRDDNASLNLENYWYCCNC